MTSVFSWQNYISLCPALFCSPRPNLPVTPDVSWFPTFAFQSPIVKRTSFLGVSSKRSCRSSENHSNQLLQHYWSGHRLGLPWYCMVCLGNEQRLFCCFRDCIQALHFGLFLHTDLSMLLSRFVPLSPSPMCSQVCPLHLRLYPCPANRLICAIFLYSIYMH